MLELSLENWMAIIFLIAFFIWGLAIFMFGRISVKHIEYEMKKEGIEQPIWDKWYRLNYRNLLFNNGISKAKSNDC